MNIQRVSSKWLKTNVLKTNENFVKHIPTTEKYNLQTLKEMIETFKTVFIKPDQGTHGKGVVRLKVLSFRNESVEGQETEDSSCATLDIKNESELVEEQLRSEDTDQIKVSEKQILNFYELHMDTTKTIFSSLEEVHESLKTTVENKVHLIQQGIALIKYKQRPFDLRILTQKNLENQWETTGIIGRVASPYKIVTNVHNGGEDLTYEELMIFHLNHEKMKVLKKELYVLGEKVAAQLEKTFPHLKEIGLDVGLDSNYYPWIIEVNTKPALYGFAKIPNHNVYRRIKYYAANYGRRGYVRGCSRKR